MNKKKTIIAIIIAAIIGGAAFGGWSIYNDSNLFNHGIFDVFNNADYYGCPNSKRVRKLNMRKKRIL